MRQRRIGLLGAVRLWKPFFMVLVGVDWRVDPHRRRQRRRLWAGPARSAPDAPRKPRCSVRCRCVAHLLCHAVMQHRRRQAGRSRSDSARRCTTKRTARRNPCACSKLSNRSGNSGRYFSVLNWLSENGLSLETCGRLCDFVTPSDAKSCATPWEVIDGPRSLWIVSCSSDDALLDHRLADQASARSALSRCASIQPTT